MTANPADTRSLVVERQISHSPEKVWRALTQSHLIEDWLMPNNFQPVVGHKFNLRADPMPHWNGVTDCEVLAIEPGRLLSYSWNSSGDEAGRLTTVVTFTLTSTNGGTHLRMEQSGFRPDNEQNYQGARYGWQKFLGELDRVVAEL
ncbi:SRPBCC domain-containing protein [Paraburkholderia sp. BL10I2N1]|uniref:SRPBCC family protein n=1 Tax=Paraburkholderia sp. BL10I2N1 TaxID=1938796 RepID=UPI00105D114E|nr:SRPBCC domain-containing protein [Paraburkholderia sp. BL10I2N1]TDN61559.1 uncharacterized protein YndB with AHSA1/START domain [Paraburkholderia sp. BL10I2N1]